MEGTSGGGAGRYVGQSAASAHSGWSVAMVRLCTDDDGTLGAVIAHARGDILAVLMLMMILQESSPIEPCLGPSGLGLSNRIY